MFAFELLSKWRLRKVDDYEKRVNINISLFPARYRGVTFSAD